MTRRVALVSDSTSVDSRLANRLGVLVVPLQVVVGSTSYDEGDAMSPQSVAEALRERVPVSTSRPAPERLARIYRQAARDGADAVLSIHLSSQVSGTFESALIAARGADIEVVAVDSQHVGMGTGFAVAAAAAALDSGADVEAAAQAARVRAAATQAFFYVDTLEYLRRGGRVGTAAALVGSALAVKPLLRIEDGHIVQHERVRTSSRAVARLEEIAVAAAGSQRVDVAVSHLAVPDRAEALAGRLRSRLPALGELIVTEVGAVIGAHTGPGMLGVVVAPR